MRLIFSFQPQQLKQLQHTANNINVNQLQLSTLEAVDRKYYLHLYINEFGEFKMTAGKTDDDPLQRAHKLFYPDLRSYVKTELPKEKHLKFLETVDAQVVSTTFPDWVKAKEITIRS